MPDYQLVSADSHVVEPMEMWQEYIDPAFRERAPRVITKDDADYIEFEGLPDVPRPVSSRPPARIRRNDRRAVDWTKGITGGWDPKARLADMDTDGVEIEVLYPTVSFGLWKSRTISLTSTRACGRTTAGWWTTSAAAPDRLIGLGMVSLGDIDAAIAEMRTFADRGCAASASLPIHGATSATGCRSSTPSGPWRRRPEPSGPPPRPHRKLGGG